MNRNNSGRLSGCYPMQKVVQVSILMVCLYLLFSSLTPAAFAYDPHLRLPWPAGVSYQILNSSNGYNQGEHTGNDYYAIDFGVSGGNQILASQGGYATTADTGGTGFGKYVKIDHGNGFTTFYAHLSSFAIANGTNVTQGQLVGYSGCTGTCYGAHLHFTARLTVGARHILICQSR